MVIAKIIGLGALVGGIALFGVFIRDAAATSLGSALGDVGSNIGVAGTGFATLGTGIGTGISGVIKPFTNLLSFFGGLTQFFGGAPAAGGSPTTAPAVAVVSGGSRIRASAAGAARARLPSFASSVSPSSTLGRLILQSQSRFPAAFAKAQGL